jgi:ornithine cyclodeaminase/alanine dehydrogenase-like protein (mu-crystallin family)
VPAIYLDEETVQDLLDMDSCLATLEEAFREEALGGASNLPRRRMPFGGRRFQLMAGSMSRKGYVGFKAYGGGGRGQDVTIYKDGEGLAAIIRSGRLGQVRTGAASGLATKFMARADAARLGCIGTGNQAETQIEAVSRVRKLESVFVYSRDTEKRRAFAQKMARQLNLDVRPADSPEDAVRGRDIVVTITNAREPVFDGRALEPGTHVNAAGGNVRISRELDEIAVSRAGTIAVDDLGAAELESGDLLWPIERGMIAWEQIVPLAPIVAGLHLGRRSDDEITLFESQGIGLEDVATGALLYERARERGLGVPLPF